MRTSLAIAWGHTGSQGGGQDDGIAALEAEALATAVERHFTGAVEDHPDDELCVGNIPIVALNHAHALDDERWAGDEAGHRGPDAGDVRALPACDGLVAEIDALQGLGYVQRARLTGCGA